MKLEVGQYIRTKKGIGKIETIEEDRSEIHFNCDSGLSIGFVKRGFTQEEMANMFEHNYNIIELVKVGDYVNGELVVRIEKDPFIKDQINLWTNTTTTNYWGDISLSPIIDKNIKTIVTKEQFEAMAYKVV